jgi:putative transposase
VAFPRHEATRAWAAGLILTERIFRIGHWPRVDPAKPHDVKVGRELLASGLNDLPLVRDVIADRGYRGLAVLAARRHVGLLIKAPPTGSSGFVPLAPLFKVEHAFARLGRWRRLSRCYEGEEPT